MKPKTLLIPGDFPPEVSGIATYFYEIWKFYDPDSNHILAAKYPGYQEFDKTAKLKIFRIHIPTGSSFFNKILKSLLVTIHVFRLHLQYQYTGIHCGQVLSSGMTGWLMKKLFNVPYIVYVYGSETYRFGKNKHLMRLICTFLKDATCIIPNSRFTKTEFLQLGIAEKKFRIITPGVDTSRFSPKKRPQSLITKYSLEGKQVLLTVARLDERKGHDRVMEAMTKLDCSHLVYLIVGKGKEKERLKMLAAQKGLEEKIIFCGYVDDKQLPEYYNLCDIFILLNRQTSKDEILAGDYEGFGIVFLEASACGKPVIAGNYGGIADAVEDQKSGFIIDCENPDTVATTVSFLLENEDQRKKMGEYGRLRASQSFTWEKISQNLQKKNG
ncbi:MAG: glycosyltransferase family 4 protein [Candidatus Marinimicrobia bacterium]|nr:glycosyltransferase family 4 protein [Candidatus Neomarinimicrobiota bacterium]